MSKEKARMLVIEDDYIAQKIAQGILEHFNYHVDIAKNGKDALQLFAENVYILVFVDLGLPDFDGCTVSEKIREIEASRSQVPIIGLSAHSDDGSKTQALNSGMNGYIVKPLTFENCSHMINKFGLKS